MDANQRMHASAQTGPHHLHKISTNTCLGLGNGSHRWPSTSCDVICVKHTVCTFAEKFNRMDTTPSQTGMRKAPVCGLQKKQAIGHRLFEIPVSYTSFPIRMENYLHKFLLSCPAMGQKWDRNSYCFTKSQINLSWKKRVVFSFTCCKHKWGFTQNYPWRKRENFYLKKINSWN